MKYERAQALEIGVRRYGHAFADLWDLARTVAADPEVLHQKLNRALHANRAEAVLHVRGRFVVNVDVRLVLAIAFTPQTKPEEHGNSEA
jgi:hypothetical protein